MVRPIVPPTVPLGTQRVRVCLHAGNTASQVEVLVRCIREWIVGMEEKAQGRGLEGRSGAAEEVRMGEEGGRMEKARL